MKKLGIMLGVVLACSVSQAQLLNGDFEAGIGLNADNWTKYGAVNREGWANHGGAQGMALEWWVGAGGGFYQDVAATAGATYTLSAWYLDDAATVLTSVYTTKIEWLDSFNLVIGADSQNVSPLVNNTWRQLSLVGTAPVGAVTARVVFDGAGMIGGETLKIDDVTLAVPEPSVLALLGLGGLLLRRRK